MYYYVLDASDYGVIFLFLKMVLIGLLLHGFTDVDRPAHCRSMNPATFTSNKMLQFPVGSVLKKIIIIWT